MPGPARALTEVPMEERIGLRSAVLPRPPFSALRSILLEPCMREPWAGVCSCSRSEHQAFPLHDVQTGHGERSEALGRALAEALRLLMNRHRKHFASQWLPGFRP